MIDVSTLKDWAAVFGVTLGFGTFGINMWTRHIDRRSALRGSYDVRIENVRELATKNATRLDQNDQYDLRRRHEALAEIVGLNTKRIDRVEIRMESVATRDDVARVDKAVTVMGGQFEVLCERLKPVVHVTERLQDFLLDPHRPVPPREPHP